MIGDKVGDRERQRQGDVGDRLVSGTESGEYDVVVIGAGLAGLTAGLFAARHRRSTLVLESGVPGGQLVNVEKIEDFPGFPEGIAGYDLGPIVQEQAEKQGAEFQMAEVQSLEKDGPYWQVVTNTGICRAKAVIVAVGSHLRELGIPGERRLFGKGVSHCATCDGPLFKDKVVGVLGGGDSALQEALTLVNYASEVILFHRRSTFSAQAVFQQRVSDHSKFDVRYNTVLEEILGDDVVTGVKTRDVITDEATHVNLAGVFLYAGLEPNTAFLKGIMRLDAGGHVLTDGWMRTELPGVFAAGDVRQDSAGQAITSAGDGAVAAIAAHRYVKDRNWPVF